VGRFTFGVILGLAIGIVDVARIIFQACISVEPPMLVERRLASAFHTHGGGSLPSITSNRRSRRQRPSLAFSRNVL